MADAAGGPAVVMLHGIGGAGRYWQALAARLAARAIPTLSPDLPGYGSRPAVTELAFDELAADVEAAVAAGGLARPVLLGHSLGGMIVQTLLRRRTLAYGGAVLACTSAAFGNVDGALQARFLAQRLAPLDAGSTMVDLAPGLVDGMLGENPDAAARATAIALMSAVPPQTYRAALRCLVTFDERAHLPRIGVPTLCLAGGRDPNAPARVMERMAARIPGARFVCLEGVGHLANLEAPQAFADAVIDFLSVCGRQPGTGPEGGRRCALGSP
jgi:pimeloyl-ACP methyl ester carboxylesterase